MSGRDAEQGIITVNAIENTKLFHQATNKLNTTTDTLYRGELKPSLFMIREGDLCFAPVKPGYTDKLKEVSVISCLNRLYESSSSKSESQNIIDLHQKLRFAGVSRSSMPTLTNGRQMVEDRDISLQRGGKVSIKNTGSETIIAGMDVMVMLPSQDPQSMIDGRFVAITVPYKPMKIPKIADAQLVTELKSMAKQTPYPYLVQFSQDIENITNAGATTQLSEMYEAVLRAEAMHKNMIIGRAESSAKRGHWFDIILSPSFSL